MIIENFYSLPVFKKVNFKTRKSEFTASPIFEPTLITIGKHKIPESKFTNGSSLPFP